MLILNISLYCLDSCRLWPLMTQIIWPILHLLLFAICFLQATHCTNLMSLDEVPISPDCEIPADGSGHQLVDTSYEEECSYLSPAEPCCEVTVITSESSENVTTGCWAGFKQIRSAFHRAGRRMRKIFRRKWFHKESYTIQCSALSMC